MSSEAPSAARVWAIAAGALLALLSCSPDFRHTPMDYQLLVFPREAELGASAAVVIGSNYIPGGDSYEDYRLEPSRVGVTIKDASDVELTATVRSVFPVAASATSRLAETMPGAWATVVLFDLPTDPTETFELGRADVIISIDGAEQLADGAVGSIVVTGFGGAGIGGQPTSIVWWGGVASLELDRILMRFRPALDPDGQSGGFPQEAGGTDIGGIEADLVYFGPCFKDAEAYTGSEAVDAGIYLGPVQVLGVGGGWWKYQRLVVTDPQGFTLQPPSGGAANALGEGPLIDITFDRPNQSVIDCEAFPGPSLFLWNVYVVRPDGTEIADQRGTGGTLGESSDLFTLHFLPVPTGP